MTKRLLTYSLLFLLSILLPGFAFSSRPIRVLVITGGHDYNKEEFNKMISSLPNVTYQVSEFPSAFEMFKPENRGKYDVLLFYHMWQEIAPEQEKMMTECVRTGKPLVVLHHSICAFDNWPGYWDMIGGKYFHKPTTFKGKEYQPCSYIHDIHFKVKIADRKHPVTSGITDFEIFDETYKGYFVDDSVSPLLTTDEPSSNQVIGWAKKYGRAKVVVLQSGHDVPTFQNPNFRKLLLQAINWVTK
jgi:type 1 glutamine amidotransferase